MEKGVPEPDYSIPEVPSGLVAVPSLAGAADIDRANRQLRAGWRFDVGESSAQTFAAAAREAVMGAARRYASVRSIAFEERPGPLIVTGHQPVLFHPGVWTKNFTVDGLARRLGGTGLNLVVDNDAAGDVGIDVPSWDGRRLNLSPLHLAGASPPDAPFETIEAPAETDLRAVTRAVMSGLSTLKEPAPARNFGAFAEALLDVRDAEDLGDLLTRARRTYEANAGTEAIAGTAYGELPVSKACGTDEFLTFFLSAAERIESFRDVYNTSLAQYRAARDIRSGANPFPDLAVDGDLVETPFWLMDGRGLRATLWLKRVGALSMVCHANGCRVELSRGRYADNIAALRREGIEIRPKALVLTLFVRMFVADLFIHGIGGAKYDRVTDDIIRGLYGVEPPGYFAVTATMWLPTGVDVSGGEAISELKQRLHALEHNPDRFAEDPALPPATRPRIRELAARKAVLVAAIGREGADKKQIGAQIREVNAGLSELLSSLRAQTEEKIAAAERAEGSRQVARHRDFPYCYWPPSAVQSLVHEGLDAADIPAGR